ncbi:MAG: sugar phosphate isomerase/epimerase [SAR202 cluster bacterium]|nr:endonuclease [Chloroflexota bacterium]MQG88145.1 sugar phosphate isomerase/epimerase [SAR202 cluster bacterium]|tara:strand:+ start:1123 stop:1926 length:804 start_codon:yes stop_codon:yes gene_type:complete
MTIKDRIGVDAGKTRLEDALKWAIENQFYYIDFNADAGPNHMNAWSKERAREVRNMCESNGISIGLHTLSAVNIAEYSPYVSNSVDEYLRGSVNLANLLGCSWTVVHAGYHFSNDYPERLKASLERLKRICKYGSETGQRILLENLNFEPEHAEVHYMAHNIKETKLYFDEIPAEELGWAFTANHSHLVPEGINGFLDTFGIDRIGEVRLADNHGEYEVHLIPGEGNINFSNLFARLENDGYKGHYSMAYGSDDERIKSRKQLSMLV